MKKFLKSLKVAGTPIELALENHIFNAASRLVEGYNGGMWDDVTVGGVATLTIPGNAETVTLRSAFSDVTTDHKTASVSFMFVAVTEFWNRYAPSLTAEQHDAFSAFYHATRNAVYSDDESEKDGVNHEDFFTITD